MSRFGYVMAIADVLAGAGARVDGLQACHEEAESIEQLVETVTDFLGENPAGRVHSLLSPGDAGQQEADDENTPAYDGDDGQGATRRASPGSP